MPSSKSRPSVKPPQKPLVFGKPSTPAFWMKILPWIFALIGIGAIAMMIAHNTERKPLICQNPLHGSASLTSFGTCTTE